MKTLKFITLLVIGLFFTSCNAQNNSEHKTSNQSTSKIEVYNFHSTHRCMTCNNIEANTKHTLNKYFPNELKNGTITIQSVNVDEKENEKIAAKFEAYGTALIINVIKNGKESTINLTEFGFMKGNNKEEFSKELKTKIETELKKL